MRQLSPLHSITIIRRLPMLLYLVWGMTNACLANTPLRQCTIDSIKSLVFPNIPPDALPTCKFTREKWKDLSTSTSIDVYDENGLANAILNHNNATINIKADILLKGNQTTSFEKDSSLKSLVNISRKQFVILGNGHKIIDFSHPIRNIKLKKDKYHAPYKKKVQGDEAFITKDGEILQLTKSKVYRAKGWVEKDPNNRIYGIIMPDELQGIRHFEDVFISFRVSFVRMTYKILSSDGHAVYFQADSTDNYTTKKFLRDLSPKTDFFLTNFMDDGKGVMIKKGTMTYPAQYENISQCQAKYIFRTKNNAQVEFCNLKMIGGMEYYVMNDASVYVHHCQLTNPIFGGIYNMASGKLFADQNNFTNVHSSVLRNEYIPHIYPPTQPYMEATNNKFTDIGHYGSNVHAVVSNGKAYIAYNEFIDVNYSAIAMGRHNCYNETPNSENLVEYNYMHHTSTWIAARQQLGFQDSGDIYIRSNNDRATIRYNTILDCGGLGKNNGIYGDDGAYNMDIYGNIVLDTENYYDIDCRDGSKKGEIRYNLPDGNHVSTNNFIAYNVCNGKLRMQQNTKDKLKQTGCLFKYNFVLPSQMNTKGTLSDIVNQTSGYQGGESIIKANNISSIVKLVKQLPPISPTHRH